MDDVIRIFSRLIAIAVGFLAACFAASLLLVFSAQDWRVEFLTFTGWRVDGAFTDLSDHPIGLIASLLLAAFATSFIGAMALVPAGLAVVLAEVKYLRALSYHLIAGGLTALAIVVATWMPPESGMRLPSDWNLFLAAGFIGGFVYWAIAGRKSGI